MEAMTPSFLKRGMSAGSTTWACSMRLRPWWRCRAGSRRRGHGGGFVADGMEAQLEAGLGAFEGHLVELRLGVLGQAGVAGIVVVGGFEGCGAGAERAVMNPLRKPVWSMGSFMSW